MREYFQPCLILTDRFFLLESLQFAFSRDHAGMTLIRKYHTPRIPPYYSAFTLK